ncbi:hypothetical protein JB92DRAFT_2834835 [Gautieria morchelliformis]|nr:hypothetical protein JB92DRAFT_2834835 [Gautieria morchelliformis]
MSVLFPSLIPLAFRTATGSPGSGTGVGERIVLLCGMVWLGANVPIPCDCEPTGMLGGVGMDLVERELSCLGPVLGSARLNWACRTVGKLWKVVVWVQEPSFKPRVTAHGVTYALTTFKFLSKDHASTTSDEDSSASASRG